jgi:hypothetical protein
MKALWVISMLSAIVGGLTATFGVLFATGAPQEAAAAAIGLSIAVIPYCFARAYESIDNEKRSKQYLDALATHTRLLAEIANRSVESATKPPAGGPPVLPKFDRWDKE